MRILLSIFVALIGFTMPAQAQDSNLYQQCGTPNDVRAFGDAEKYCDIYQRQLAYREKRIELRQEIESRREAFIEPAHQARGLYEKDIEALNAERSHDTDITSK